MAWLLLNNNFVTEIITHDPTDAYHPDMQIIEVPEGWGDIITDDFLKGGNALFWDGSNLQVENLDKAKAWMKKVLADARWIKEMDGVEVNSVRLHTSREAIAAMHGAYYLSQQDSTRTFNFKVMSEPTQTPSLPPEKDANGEYIHTVVDNPWISVSAADFPTYYEAALDHVQRCYDAEVAVAAEIDAAADLAGLAAINIGERINANY